MRQGRSESKYRVRCTELTTDSQNPSKLLGHAEFLQRGCIEPLCLRTICFEEDGYEIGLQPESSFDLFGLNLSARASLPATAIGIMEAVLKWGLHSWRV